MVFHRFSIGKSPIPAIGHRLSHALHHTPHVLAIARLLGSEMKIRRVSKEVLTKLP